MRRMQGGLAGMFGGRGGRAGFGAAGRPFGGGPGGGDITNFLVGQQNGITSAHSLGVSYSDFLTKDLDVTGSCFFNLTDNTNDQTLRREYIVSHDSSTFYDELSNSGSKNYNHRLDLKIEYTIDPSNSLIVRPQVSFQKNNTTSFLNGMNSLSPSLPLSQSTSDNSSTANGYNGSANLVHRHRFETVGRTLSIDLGVRANKKENGSDLTSLSRYSSGMGGRNEAIDQKTAGESDGTTLSSRLAYTEPFAGGLLQFNYNPSYNRSTSDTKTNHFDPSTGGYTRLDARLSNTFENEYTTHNGGVDYRFRLDNVTISAGVSYQVAQLQNSKTFPFAATIDKSFYSLLPNAMLTYSLGFRNNLRINYRTSTQAPSINQLQDVLDNSNPLLLSTGNPDLRQATTHSIIGRYIAFDLESGRTMFAFLTVGYTRDVIGNSTIVAGRDTVADRGIRLSQGTQLSFPVNLDHSWNINSLLVYSLPVSFLPSNLNLMSGFSFIQTPGIVNNVVSRTNLYTLNQGFVLGSNISEEIDFTLTYSANYNIATYTLQPDLTDKYFFHTANLKFNWMVGEGIVFRNETANTLYRGLGEGQDRNYVIWNVGVGKKFFESDKGELRVGVNDLLNQNTSIRRSVTDVSIENTTNRVLGRYALLTFTYTIR